MFKIIKSSLFLFFVSSLLYSCALFEQEFILPMPVASDADQVTSLGFTAHWNRVTGAKSYEIDIALDKEFIEKVDGYDNKQVNANELTITELEANTTYYYRIRAHISNKTSQNSNIIEVTTTTLDLPTVYAAANVSATGFRLHWKKIQKATAYMLDIASDESFTKFIEGYNSKEIAAPDTSLLVRDVTVNHQYFYRIRIKQSKSLSEYSNILSVFTSTLAAPKVLDATNIGLTSFTAMWKIMSEAQSYRIDVATDALFQKILPKYKNVAIKGNSIVVINLNANVTYYYRVRAVNAKVTSNHSQVKPVTTLNLTSPIATDGTKIESGGFQANWNKVARAASYLLDVALDAGFSQVLPGYNSLPVINSFASVTNLNASTTYYYRIRAVGLNATSGYSNTQTITTRLLPAPVATAATNQKVFGFTANWEAQTDITVYLLDVATNPTFTNFVTGYQNKEVTGTSSKVKNLDFKTTYYYRLRTKRLSKLSEYSNVIKITPCITASCKLKQVDFLGAYTSYDSKQRGQTYIYDSQNRLSEIYYHEKTDKWRRKVDLRFYISYNADGTIKKVSQRYNGSWYASHLYTYSGGLLTQIRQQSGSGYFMELWTFTYNSNKERTSWTIYSNEAQTRTKHKFTYIRDDKGNVVTVKDKNDNVFREYTYTEGLSPFALFNPDLCFFIATNRDQWTDDEERPEYFEDNEFRGFLPLRNIDSETTGSLEIFKITLNAKGVATHQKGYFSATYIMQGCGF